MTTAPNVELLARDNAQFTHAVFAFESWKLAQPGPKFSAQSATVFAWSGVHAPRYIPTGGRHLGLKLPTSFGVHGSRGPASATSGPTVRSRRPASGSGGKGSTSG